MTHYCHKHKRTYLIQLELNSPSINFGWVSWSEQKIKTQADAGTELELKHWVIGWPCGQSLDLFEPQQSDSTAGGKAGPHCMPGAVPSLPGWATKQQNKHANTESFPQWFNWPLWLLPQRLRVTRKSVRTRMISLVLGGLHSLFSHHRLEHPCGIAKNALKKYTASVGKTESTGRSTCVCAEHSCTWTTKDVSMV